MVTVVDYPTQLGAELIVVLWICIRIQDQMIYLQMLHVFNSSTEV